MISVNQRKVNNQNAVGATALFEAVSARNIKRAWTLLKNGADPNVPENNGITPLMEAASGGHLSMVKLLIANGARKHVQDSFGDTALDYAENGNFKKVAAYLKS